MEENKTIFEETTEKVKKGNLELFKIILMIGLLITMIVLAVVIWKYTQQMKLNPCDFCDSCKNLIQVKGGLG